MLCTKPALTCFGKSRPSVLHARICDRAVPLHCRWLRAIPTKISESVQHARRRRRWRPVHSAVRRGQPAVTAFYRRQRRLCRAGRGRRTAVIARSHHLVAADACSAVLIHRQRAECARHRLPTIERHTLHRQRHQQRSKPVSYSVDTSERRTYLTVFIDVEVWIIRGLHVLYCVDKYTVGLPTSLVSWQSTNAMSFILVTENMLFGGWGWV